MTAPEESRLLYLLLEGAQNEGRLRNLPAEPRWHDLRRRYDPARPADLHAELVALFREVERTEVLVGTWIQFRWRKARAAEAHLAPSPMPKANRPRRAVIPPPASPLNAPHARDAGGNQSTPILPQT